MTAPRLPDPLPIAEVPTDLRRDGVLGRFGPEHESAYRAWLTQQIIPLGRIISWTSIPFWIAIPVVCWPLQDVDVTAPLLVISTANVCILVFGLAVALRRWPGGTIAWATFGLLVVGADTTYLMTTDVVSSGGPGVVAAGATFMTLLAPFLRLPFRASALVSTTLVGLATAILVQRLASDDYPLSAIYPYFVYLGITLAMVPGIALAVESQLRAKYVDEQVIVRQQAQLGEAHRLVRRYAPPAVADRIEHGEASSVDEALRRRVTVLFSDVVGFTDLADKLDPEALAQVVNEYLAQLAEIIERHRGTLNEFAGDGVMALFGAPTELDPEDQVEAAVAAAREIQVALPAAAGGWAKLGVDRELQARIGINTGVLSIGSFGSEGRKTYTGIGLQTNIAARIQAHCEPGGILLSHTSWQLVKDRIECEPRGEVMVKGVHFPIATFAPVPSATGG